MLKKIIIPFFNVLVLFAILFYAVSCSKDNTVTPTGPTPNTISGTITFVDTTAVFDTAHGYYSVDAYASWPPMASPTASSKLTLIRQADKSYKATYTVSGLANGNYVITTSYIKLPYVVGQSVLGLGIYSNGNGCDTAHTSSCIFGSVPKVTISSNNGVTGINFLSWSDTTKKTYNF